MLWQQSDLETIADYTTYRFFLLEQKEMKGEKTELNKYQMY